MGRSLGCLNLAYGKNVHASLSEAELGLPAADRYTMAELFDLLEAVGASIAALKTHVDLIDDWNMEEWKHFCERASIGPPYL